MGTGGDGPKMVELEQMREKYQLQDRIELLGSIKPSDVRDVSLLAKYDQNFTACFRFRLIW
jgi:hypothetical protein